MQAAPFIPIAADIGWMVWWPDGRCHKYYDFREAQRLLALGGFYVKSAESFDDIHYNLHDTSTHRFVGLLGLERYQWRDWEVYKMKNVPPK